ncbi:hypothetical protein [Yoonia sp. 2307UL14-13]|uniref:hypothetical protein n=1 Tax=Yoonia sp. 2307UL14-13 TaxID=3126506 RepID=UPI0030B63D33
MPDPRPLVFADLDDTLFQSRRKMTEDQIARPAAVAGNGDPRKASFMTARQATLFDWLNTTTELIPVTARSGDAFSRVDLPFSSWAIVSNGAVILEPGGATNIPWQQQMNMRLLPLQDRMNALLDEGRSAATNASIDVRSWIVTEGDLATYVVFKLNVITPDSISALKALPVDCTGWTRHFNTETLALIPPGSGKAAAVNYLHAGLNADGARPTLGFGDSLSDLDFMRATDVMMIPSRSQIAQTL